MVGDDGKPAIAKTFHQVFGTPAWRPGERASGASNQLRNLAARGQKRISKSLGIAADGSGASVIMTAARGKSLATIGARKRRPNKPRTYALDVYALGASLRYMVTGEAFDGRAFDAAFVLDRSNQRAATQALLKGGSVEEAASRFPTNNLEKAIRAELAKPYQAPPGLATRKR